MPIIHPDRPEIMDSVALLVLDAQDCFIDTLHNKEAFLKRCAFAIEAARCLDLYTLFTEQAPEKLGRTNATLFKLAKNPRVFAKRSFSALNAPGIEAFLRDNEIYHILIAGLETPICIYQTGLQATDEDVDVTFFTDALGSRRPEDDAPVLDTLIRLGCHALPSESVFYSLIGDTTSPYFHSFNELVKAFGEEDFSIEKYLENRPMFAEVEKPQKERPTKSPRPQHESSQDQESHASSERPRQERYESEESRAHKRGRRRRGGRGRNREHQEEPRQKRQEPQAPTPTKPEPSKPEKEATGPQKALKAQDTPTTRTEVPEKPATAKKASTKKKAAKKAVKKVAKKTVKKVARKKAKKAGDPE